MFDVNFSMQGTLCLVCNFVFLFLVPFVLDPAISTLTHKFIDVPVSCKVGPKSWLVYDLFDSINKKTIQSYTIVIDLNFAMVLQEQESILRTYKENCQTGFQSIFLFCLFRSVLRPYDTGRATVCGAAAGRGAQPTSTTVTR